MKASYARERDVDAGALRLVFRERERPLALFPSYRQTGPIETEKRPYFRGFAGRQLTRDLSMSERAALSVIAQRVHFEGCWLGVRIVSAAIIKPPRPSRS
jgi:hypothetical protein